MAIYSLPPNADDGVLKALLLRYLRYPQAIYYSGMGGTPTAIEYIPDLSVGEQSILNTLLARLSSISDLDKVPNWATYSGQQATDAIHTAIFNGQDAVTIKANIATTLTDITTANVNQINIRLAAIRTLLGNAVDAIIAIRTILENIGKIVAYIRDIALR